VGYAAWGGVMVQASTRQVSVRTIMRSVDFRQGVADVRSGRPPRFDDYIGWWYEWGRQYGVIAPRRLEIMSATGKTLNAKALEVFNTNGDVFI
jgi:hypothetical protein